MSVGRRGILDEASNRGVENLRDLQERLVLGGLVRLLSADGAEVHFDELRLCGESGVTNVLIVRLEGVRQPRKPALARLQFGHVDKGLAGILASLQLPLQARKKCEWMREIRRHLLLRVPHWPRDDLPAQKIVLQLA